MRRALALLVLGSLFDRIAMNTRLSMPSTTSSTTRVSSAAQAAGSESKAMISMANGLCPSAGPLASACTAPSTCRQL